MSLAAASLVISGMVVARARARCSYLHAGLSQLRALGYEVPECKGCIRTGPEVRSMDAPGPRSEDNRRTGGAVINSGTRRLLRSRGGQVRLRGSDCR